MGKITYGLSNLYYAKVSVSDQGVVSYATPVRLPGARELTLDVSGEPTIIWADNIQYVTIAANAGYEGNVTVLTVPQSFYTDILGMSLDTNGVLCETENDTLSQFALLGEFDTEDSERKRFVLYNCTASKPSFGGSTKEDTVEAYEFEIPITAGVASDTGIMKASVTNALATQAQFENWLSAVYVPTISSATAPELTALTIGTETLTPTFDGGVNIYTTSTTDASSVVTATPDDGANVTLTLNGAALANGDDAEWVSGNNIIVITVTKPGCPNNTYYVTVSAS